MATRQSGSKNSVTDESRADEREGAARSDLPSFGLALIVPAVVFTIAASFMYPPAARVLTPVAGALCLVGLGLVLAGRMLARRGRS